jgi:MEMO1 family protein
MSAVLKTRPAAVAGYFYPADAGELRATIDECFAQAARASDITTPQALIVPHAGYIYSGTVAAAAYASVQSIRQRIRNIVLIGPSHRVPLRGVAVPQADAFATPLGAVPIDIQRKLRLVKHGLVFASDVPHAQEHSLEVQLPFLQTLFAEFTLLPLVTGEASASHVAAVLAEVWGDEETLVLASSDLSHYHTYDEAQNIDAQTAQAILQRRSDLTGEQACGCVSINGLLHLAAARNYQVGEIARLNSGDRAGDRHRVVGYGAFGIYATHA